MRWEGLLVATHPDVYRPSDDTFLLARCVADEIRPGARFLEVGCGTGVVALTASRQGAHAAAVDRNPAAVSVAAANARSNELRVDVVLGDLLAPFGGPFDVVAFNPPYLPTAPEEVLEGPLNLAFDGGPSGNETVLRFARQLEHVPAATVLVVHSSLSDPKPLDDAMADLGYTLSIAAHERHPFEVLTVRRYATQAPGPRG